MTRAAAVSGAPALGREPSSVEPSTAPAMTVGLAAIVFSVVYLASDVLEVAHGGFSTVRLALTYAGEAAIPLFVLGLYALQRPHIDRRGMFGAAAFAYSYVFFTSTVVYALVAAHTATYDGVTAAFGAWMTVHGLIMLIGGVAFGLANRPRPCPSPVGPDWVSPSVSCTVPPCPLSRIPDQDGVAVRLTAGPAGPAAGDPDCAGRATDRPDDRAVPGRHPPGAR